MTGEYSDYSNPLGINFKRKFGRLSASLNLKSKQQKKESYAKSNQTSSKGAVGLNLRGTDSFLAML